MTRKTLDKLQKNAKYLGKEVFRLYENPKGGHNDFNDFNYDNDLPKEELLSNGGVRFHFNKFARIDFSNVRPSKVNDIIYGTPSIRNEKIEDVNTVSLYNNTDSEIERTYEFNKEFEMTMETNIEVAISIGISQEISAGSELYGIQSTTTISSEISTAIQKNLSKTNSLSTTDTIVVPVPPRSRIDLVSRRSVSDFEQLIKADCSLDFDIRGQSHNDFDVSYTSIKDLQDNFLGVAYQEDHNFKRQVFGKRDKMNLIKAFGGNLKTILETTIKFSNASTGNVNANQMDL